MTTTPRSSTAPRSLSAADSFAAQAAVSARATVRRDQILSAAARILGRSEGDDVSIQAIAIEAKVSVGLIYRYFPTKEKLLIGVLDNILSALDAAVTRTMATRPRDPIAGVVALFAAYCHVIDEHRHAALLTYRESNSLDSADRHHVMQSERATSNAFRDLLLQGQRAGEIRPLDVDVTTSTVLLMAHAWALKHWQFPPSMTLAQYVTHQSAFLKAALTPVKGQTET